MGRSKKNGCPTCEVCGKTGDVKRCSGCKCVYYCGVEHQREDRKAHKYLCRITQDVRICTTPLDELGARGLPRHARLLHSRCGNLRRP